MIVCTKCGKQFKDHSEVLDHVELTNHGDYKTEGR